MRNLTCCLLLSLAIEPLARAQDCPWLPDSRMDEAYPQMAPWSTLAEGVGRCKFNSVGRRPNNFFTLTSMVKATPREAESYVRSLHDSMAKTYQASPLPAIGPGGFGVKPRDDGTSGFLTLVGHRGKVVVMAQLTFREPVTDAEKAVAVALTKETFSLADDPVDAGCRTEAVSTLGPGATLSWGCTGGRPRASVRYTEPHRVVELHLTPGREPTAEERKSLVELARLARARHV